MQTDITKLQKQLAHEIAAREEAEAMLSSRLCQLTNRLDEEKKSLKRKNFELNIMLSVTNMADQNYDYHDYLQNFLDIICENMNWPIGHIYHVNHDTGQVIPGDLWTTDNKLNDALLKELTSQCTFNKGEGLPGQCFHKEQSVWVEDMLIDHGSKRTPAFEALGLRAALALPILVQNRIAAVAEFFLYNCTPKDIYLLQLVEGAAKQLGLLLQKGQSEHEIMQKNQQLSDTVDKLQAAQLTALHAEKMASIGQLAAGVAHEINNPIGYVTGNVDIMGEYSKVFQKAVGYLQQASEQCADDSLKQQIAEFMQEEDLSFLFEDLDALIPSTKKGLVRVRDIVNNLKAFARMDTANERELFSINHCVETTLEMVNNELKYHCQIHLRLAEDLPLVHINAGQVDQVILNLLVNAGQAIEGQGEITITSTQVQDFIHLEITDNGKGIPAEILDKIFDPFYTTKPVGSGTGLGLSVSYGIIEKHGGDISVQSTVGVGSTFMIRLPIAKEGETGE